MGELLEGDADDDNRIRITDFGILRNAYFTDEGDPDFDPRADFDEDDRIRIRDFSLLRLNYFQSGDIEVTSAGQGADVSSQYFGGKGVHVGIASIRRLSRPSGRIETQDASGSTDNPLGLPRLFEKIRTDQILQAVDMSVEPPTITVTVEDQFTVTVKISAGTQEVDGAEFDLRFEPLFLQVVDEAGQPANQIEPAGPLPEVLFNEVDPVAGRIRYAAGTFDTASGEFPLVILRFRALASTQATNLHYAYADVTAPGGQSVVGELRDGTVSIGGRLVKCYLPSTLRNY